MEDVRIARGSGNVFADLGLPHPEERQAKANIAIHIEHLIDDAGWTQQEAADKMGISQPDVSNILRGRLKGFTLDRLIQCLNALGQDVEISIRPNAAREQGRVIVACS